MAKASDFLVAVDAGHYLSTAGKRTPYIESLGREIKEHEFNAPTAGFCIEALRRCGFRTIQTNDPDRDTPLTTRAERANKAGADIFMSFHFNAFDGIFDEGANPSGHDIYIYPGSVEGRRLAESIFKFLPNGTKQVNRGIKEANFTVLVKTLMPAILSENGFMDNTEEWKLMLNEDFQKEVAEEHCQGVCDYFNVPYVPAELSDWDKKPMDSFVTKRELLGLLNAQGKTPATPEPVKPVSSNPKTIRKYGSFIHIFEADKGMKVDVDLGVRFEKEKVSKIVRDKIKEGKDIVLGINLGFFSWKPGSEHSTLYIDEGLYYNPPSGETMDFIYYKDGTTKIVNIKGYDKEQLNAIQANAHWGIGTSYSLVIDGKVDIRNAQNFPHAGNKEPRTMFGQKKDGSFILVVTDGRTDESSGLTAHEQAELMYDLGCINAVNADGGGSSTMVEVKDGVPKVVNALNGAERAVGSVMLVYKGGW